MAKKQRCGQRNKICTISVTTVQNLWNPSGRDYTFPHKLTKPRRVSRPRREIKPNPKNRRLRRRFFTSHPTSVRAERVRAGGCWEGFKRGTMIQLPRRGSEHGAPFPQRSPALAVGTRLKPARNGRWVASAALLCFQLPTGGREACNSRGESASRLRNVGLKGSKMTHEPSRADAAYSVLRMVGTIPPRPRRAPP